MLFRSLGFDAITEILNNLLVTDPNTAVVLSLKMLGLDAEGKREGGNLYWDDIIFHEDIVE